MLYSISSILHFLYRKLVGTFRPRAIQVLTPRDEERIRKYIDECTHLSSNLPQSLTPEAEKLIRGRIKGYEEVLKRSREVVKFNVLVWGPSPASKSPVVKKRAEIRYALQYLNHKALFSEEIPASGAGHSLVFREYAQALSADAIVVLVEGSLGAHGEVHDFGGNPDIAIKMHIMIPEYERTQYTGLGVVRDIDEAFRNVYWYKDGEIEGCTVLKEAVTRIEAKRRIVARHRGLL